jgi:signal transduction histidine kinase
VEILEEASQGLTQTLGQELLFLKALTSESLAPGVRDLYPLLIHSIKDLLDLRFRDKDIRVEINGQPLEQCQDSLVFAFEPYTMEVILQNLLSNSMKFGDHIQVEVGELDGRVRVEIKDNGPGLEMEKLKHRLLTPADRREAESTHLGLKVSLHLIHKSGGRLFVQSKPGPGLRLSSGCPSSRWLWFKEKKY